MGFNNGPYDLSNGNPVTARVNGYPDTACMVIFNESPYFINVQLDASNSVSLPAYTADIVPVSSGFSGNMSITPLTYLTAQGQAPATSVFISTYGGNDPLTRLLFSGMPTGYPIALARLSNIGNSLNVSTSATSLVNDNNPLATQIIESTPSGAPGSTIVVTNSGDVTIKGDVAGVLTTLLQIISASSTVNISATGKQTNVNGNLTVAQNFLVTNGKVGMSGAGDFIDASSGTDAYFKCPGTNATVHLRDNSGTEYCTFTPAGVNPQNGINFTVGRIKEINSGSNVSGTINHGLSGVPTAVLVTCNTSLSSATVGASNYTSTQFRLDVGGGLNGRWVAYR